LNQEIIKLGASKAEDVFLAELDTSGKLSVDLINKSIKKNKPEIF